MILVQAQSCHFRKSKHFIYPKQQNDNIFETLT